MKEFMKILVNPDNYPNHKAIIHHLRAHYSFYIIPSCNPDGYESGDYGNDNGVSVTENIDFNWELASDDPTDPYYRGPYPFSEPETIIIRDVILTVKPISVIDTHTWGGHTGFYYGHLKILILLSY